MELFTEEEALRPTSMALESIKITGLQLKITKNNWEPMVILKEVKTSLTHTIEKKFQA